MLPVYKRGTIEALYIRLHRPRMADASSSDPMVLD